MCDSLGLVDELVRVVPVFEQLGLRHVVQTDVHVLEVLGEEVVDLPRHVQDVPDAATTHAKLQAYVICLGAPTMVRVHPTPHLPPR